MLRLFRNILKTRIINNIEILIAIEIAWVAFPPRSKETRLPSFPVSLVLAALPINQFVVVWRATTKTWVPVAEKIEALVASLPEETRLEVFDFARFIYSRRQGYPQRE